MTEERVPYAVTGALAAEELQRPRTASAEPAPVRTIDHEGDATELSARLRSAYQALEPGEVVRVRLTHRDFGGPLSSQRDRVSGILFGTGFTETRLVRASDGALEVSTRRATTAPPTERRVVLSVVMPVYNERPTFTTVADLVLKKEIEGVDIELIIVESNSTDGSRAEVLRYADHPRVRLVLEDRPHGKGHAVRAGLRAATGDFVLIQDADLEYDVDDYDALLAPLRSIESGFVLGERRRTDGARFGVRHFETQVLVGRLMNVGNIVFLTLFNAVYSARLRDPFTMYKVFRRDCLTGLRLECNRFDFDWELTGKLLRAGYRPVEVPVSYRSRSFAEGKKVSVLADPWSWIVACVKYRFAPLYDE